MKYKMTIEVTGNFYVTIDANTQNDARTKAIEEFCDADFGVLEDIDCEITNIKEVK